MGSRDQHTRIYERYPQRAICFTHAAPRIVSECFVLPPSRLEQRPACASVSLEPCLPTPRAGYSSAMRILLLAIGCATLIGCTYNGDGDLRVEGTWPLRSYQLTLPAIELEPGNHRFNVSDLPNVGAGPRTFLTVAGYEPMVCTRLSTNVTVRLLAANREVLLQKTGPLNRLVERVWREHSNDAPSDGEWWPSDWLYLDEAIARRVVPLEPGIDSLPQEECRYWSREVVPADEVVWLEIDVERGRAEGTLRIMLSEGWK